MTAPTTIQPGDVLLGKYQVERVLGQGGMGMVVAARHLTLGGLFAIKVMLPEMLDNPEAIGRFLREARASARLRGEHVARVHDVGSLENGVPYMVLEYLEGTDLDKEVVSRGALGVGEACAYVMQVCEALVEAHAQGIVHRDLKPANLFLTRRPNGEACIKVLDFGISKDLASAEKISSKLTKTGTIMGSPHYMSPEQLVDSKNVDTRSDIWALGIILYELVTGTMPFQAETMPEIIAKVLSLQPTPPSQVRPGISAGLDAIVARCMEKDRDKRFQSIQEFMTSLRPFVNESDKQSAISIRVIPPTTGSAMAQSTIGWGHATVPSQLPPSETTTGSSRKIMVIAGVFATLVVLGFAAFAISQPKDDKIGRENVGAASNAPVKPAVEQAPNNPVSEVKTNTSATPVASENAGIVAPTIGRVLAPVPSTVKSTKKKVKGFDE